MPTRPPALDTAPTTDFQGDRFAGLGPRLAASVIGLLIALFLLGLGAGHPVAPVKPVSRPGDKAFYLRLIDDLRHGEPYYPAVVREHRVGGYPLRPFLTVRLPTLAMAMAALPDAPARQLAVEVLAAATGLAWAWRLRTALRRPLDWTLAMLLLAFAIIPAFSAGAYVVHELWAGELMALSLALHTPRRWPISLALGLAALALRELAAPYVVAMGVLAWREGRRREAAAWVAGLVLFAAGLALHAAQIRLLVRPSDPPSPGWLALGGWKFVLLSMRWNLALLVAPSWVAALLAPLVAAGLAASRGPLANRVQLVVAGYAFAFLFVGRNDNDYWGLLITPLWALGLVNVRPALTDLIGSIWPQAWRLSPISGPAGPEARP